MFDQSGAETAHCRVFLSRVAMWHHDRHGNASACASECERLAMVAAGRSNNSSHLRPFALEAVKINDAAAYLESADRCVVLVLDHNFHAGLRLEQRPGILRSRR